LPCIDAYVIAALAFARMARAGVTSIVHCHLSSDPASLIVAAEEVARAAQDVGLRVAFVVPLRDRNRLGYGADEAILAYMEPGDLDAIAARWLKPIPSISAQLDAVETIASRCENPFFSVQYGNGAATLFYPKSPMPRTIRSGVCICISSKAAINAPGPTGSIRKDPSRGWKSSACCPLA